MVKEGYTNKLINQSINLFVRNNERKVNLSLNLIFTNTCTDLCQIAFENKNKF